MNSLTRLTLTALALSPCIGLAASTLPANDTGPSPNFTGSYIGLGVGSQSTVFTNDNSSSFSFSTLAPVTAQSRVVDKNKTAPVLGEIEASCGFYLPKKTYMGLSGFIDFANQKTGNYLNLTIPRQAHYSDLKNTAKKLSNVSGGIALEPGVFLTPQTFLLGIIGWQTTQETTLANHQVQMDFSSYGSEFVLQKERLNGLKIGLGLLQQITPALALGARYVYISLGGSHAMSTPTAMTTLFPGGSLQDPFSYTVGKQKVNTQTLMANMRLYLDNTSKKVEPHHFAPNALDGFYATARLGVLTANMA